MANPVDTMLDTLVADLRATFRSFLLAYTSNNLGERHLNSINDDAGVTVALGVDIAIEPLPVGELKQYRGVFPMFITEVFHGRFVQLWQQILDSIFAHYVRLHFSGEYNFAELKKRQVIVDFRSAMPATEQIQEHLLRAYEFDSYPERVSLIGKIRNPDRKQQEHFDSIRKNVTLRNCFQHNKGVLSTDALDKLGVAVITVLDTRGKTVTLKAGDRIYLSLPELNKFRQSLLLAAQAWRAK